MPLQEEPCKQAKLQMSLSHWLFIGLTSDLSLPVTPRSGLTPFPSLPFPSEPGLWGEEGGGCRDKGEGTVGRVAHSQPWRGSLKGEGRSVFPRT